MTVDELCERWGCTAATIYCHIKEGRLDCIDTSRTGIDWSKRGPKQVAFTESQVEDFERKRAMTFAKAKADDPETQPADLHRGPGLLRRGSGLVRVPKRKRRTEA